MAEQKNAMNAGETVHVEIIAVFYATLLKKDPQFAADYKLMSALSFGERSISAFTWNLRKIRQRAKEIVDEANKKEANGEGLKPRQYSKGRSPPAKRARPKKEDDEEDECGGDDEDQAANGKAQAIAEPEAKRAKTTQGAVKSPEVEASAELDVGNGADGDKDD